MSAQAAKPFRPNVSLLTAMTDPHLFGSTFAAESFWTWRTVAKLIDGTPLTEPREIELFKKATGRSVLPNRKPRRLFILVGRRGGKDRFFSAVAIWRAVLLADWRRFMSAGEQAVVTLLGADRRQAALMRRYADGLVDASPLLSGEVVRRTDDVIEFSNDAALEIATNNAALVRGRSAVCVLGSECCYWRTDEASASSDEEVVGAASPALSMCPDGGLLVLGSSVHRRRGFMHRQWRELFGNDAAEDIVWLLGSRDMNPRLPAAVVDKALADDAAKAGAEFLSIWRSDLETYVAREAVEACVSYGVRERPPRRNVTYHAFLDPAGGAGADAFGLAIAHRNAATETVVIDCLRERTPPFSPEQVCSEYAKVLKSYRCFTVSGDRFAGHWPVEQLGRFGITYQQSAAPKSVLYTDFLPLLNSGRVELLDHPKSINQLCSLERRSSRGGKDTVDHAPGGGGHDDCSNVIAGVAATCVSSLGGYSLDGFQDDFVDRDDPDPGREARHARMLRAIYNGTFHQTNMEQK
jgi:hypothetical protein